MKRQYLSLAGIAIVAACALSGCGTANDNNANAQATTEKPAADTAAPSDKGDASLGGTEDLNLVEFSLKPGECFNDADTQKTKLKAIDCTSPHDSEVISTYTSSVKPYSDAAVENEAGTKCVDEFASYVGTDYNNSSLDLTFIWNPNDWDSGTPTVYCYVIGTDLTQSVAGSGL